MKVIRFDNGEIANRREYQTSKTNIREVAAEFGRTEDTIELYDETGALIARAIWPQGSKCYMYSYGKNLDENPAWCNYIY